MIKKENWLKPRGRCSDGKANSNTLTEKPPGASCVPPHIMPGGDSDFKEREDDTI
jgi:hypothetical protein